AGGNRENNNSNPIILLVLAVIAPLAASIIQMSISRSREYAADRGAAELTGHPEWLISALQKLDYYAQGSRLQNADPSSAHMFIVNPLSGVQSNFSSLFRTHPSTQDRIDALEELMR
ncbi:MAG: M48 family metalloprotease, partial [Campylobacteraceae bacterium]|nr:M48 family metalloprotease [Campylobacteraceae bacterium]